MKLASKAPLRISYSIIRYCFKLHYSASEIMKEGNDNKITMTVVVPFKLCEK